MTIRVLELADQLKVGIDDLLAVCTLVCLRLKSSYRVISFEYTSKLLRK